MLVYQRVTHCEWGNEMVYEWDFSMGNKKFFLIVKDGDMAYYNGITMEVQLNIL